MSRRAATKGTRLVTGGAGFIGSHLVERLLAGGHHVLAVDDLSSGRLENLAAVIGHPRLQWVKADVTEPGVLESLASEAGVIFHLAAMVGVKLVVEQPLRCIETNFRATEQVLRAALRHGCRVLLASSSEVYGKTSKIPFREDDDVVLGPSAKLRWSYAAGKMLDEFLALAYCRQLDLAATVFRLFNTIGPRQSGRYGMVVPRLAGQALRGEPLTVFGSGRQTRCFCDVQDVVQAIVGLSEQTAAAGQVFNIGATREVSIGELAEIIRALCDSPSPIVHVPYEKAYPSGFEDMMRRVPDTTRIAALTGWRPSRSLEETLLSVIAQQSTCQAGESASVGTAALLRPVDSEAAVIR